MVKRIRFKGVLYESVINEAKADEERFRSYVGDELADTFYKLKPRIKSPYNDIYYWLKRDTQELKDYLDSLSQTKTQKDKRDLAKQGAERIYSDDRWDVYHITTYEASQQYGKGTKWCITGSKDANTEGRGGKYWFDAYTEDGIQFYFYFDKENNEKYALALYGGSTYNLFNAEDTIITGILGAPHIEGLPDIDSDGFEIEDQDDGTRELVRYSGNLADVTVPEGVDIIGSRAFSGTRVKYVKLPEGVFAITGGAFKNSALKSIKIPSTLEMIGPRAFDNTHLGTIDLSKTQLTQIPSNCFYMCDDLTSVFLPRQIGIINDGAFLHCDHLKKIVYRGTIKQFLKIQNYALPTMNESCEISCDDGTITVPELITYSLEEE